MLLKTDGLMTKIMLVTDGELTKKTLLMTNGYLTNNILNGWRITEK